MILFFLQDKTFGLKNKKGKKQQQFIKNVQNQVKYGQQSSQKLEAMQYDAKVDIGLLMGWADLVELLTPLM